MQYDRNDAPVFLYLNTFISCDKKKRQLSVFIYFQRESETP